MYELQICQTEDELVKCFMLRNNYFIDKLHFDVFDVFDGLDELSCNFLLLFNKLMIGSLRIRYSEDNDYIVEFITMDSISMHLDSLIELIDYYMQSINVLEYFIAISKDYTELFVMRGFVTTNKSTKDYIYLKKYLLEV